MRWAVVGVMTTVVMIAVVLWASVFFMHPAQELRECQLLGKVLSCTIPEPTKSSTNQKSA